MRDEFGIELFQKKGEEAVQVWYKDTKIFEGGEKAVKDYINQLDKKSTPNRKLFLEGELKGAARRLAYEEFIKAFPETNLTKLREHIFEGHFGTYKKINPATKGIHSVKELESGKIRMVKGSRRPPNPKPDEVFEAKVQKRAESGEWIDKFDNEGYSTFFPESWSEQRIMEEIAFAWKGRTADINPAYYLGHTTEGVKLKFVIRESNLITVYPVKPL